MWGQKRNMILINMLNHKMKFSQTLLISLIKLLNR